MITGFAVVDKPAGWTSHDVVGRLRRLFGQRRVGHAGTLDPMATGVLVCGLGYATRLLRFVQEQPKTYEATVRLGVGTVTDDADGEVIDTPGCPVLEREALDRALSVFTGPIEQVPSAVSAVKLDGQRAHAMVRAGKTPQLAARPVVVTEFSARSPLRTGVQAGVPVVDFDAVVVCSSGTYVRALARDLGRSLGVGGHLRALRRTAIGPFTEELATPLGDQPPGVLTVDEVMPRLLPRLDVDAEQERALRDGRPLQLALPVPEAAAIGPGGRFVGVVRPDADCTRPLLNMPDLAP